MKAILRCDF